jgi:AraC-like DNA-binding protein
MATKEPFNVSTFQKSPQIRVILKQIIQYTYTGTIRSMFMESKSFELITVCVMNWEMENPPTVIEVARRVDLSEWKLKAGFHKLFGTTLFAFLRDYRLEQAIVLLDKERMNDEIGSLSALTGAISLIEWDICSYNILHCFVSTTSKNSTIRGKIWKI